jgi:hypothetical protein
MEPVLRLLHHDPCNTLHRPYSGMVDYAPEAGFLGTNEMKVRALKYLVIVAPLLILGYFFFFMNRWPGVDFVEVRAYAWPIAEHEENVYVIVDDMSLRPDVLNKEGAVLSADQVKRLMLAVTGEHKEHPVASCYIPHNAFVFYNAEKKPVAFIEICFDCLGERIVPKGAARRVDLPALASLFVELKLPAGRYGDAKSFMQSMERMSNTVRAPDENSR